MVLLIGLFFVIYSIVKLVVSFLEISYLKKAKSLKPVILSEENYLKAASYKISNEKLSIINTIVGCFTFFFWVLFGINWLEKIVGYDGELYKSVLIIFLFFVVSYFLSLPMNLYVTFVNEKKYGFSNITPKIFFIDQIKSLIVFSLIAIPLLFLLGWVINSFSWWWILGFCIVFCFVLLANIIYPTIIAPMFNKFTPLENSDLKDSIEGLLTKAGFKNGGLFRVDASKRDKRLNAYFGGIGKSKRVVLFDTLIEKLSTNELLAVLGHELGHFKHGDIYKMMLFMGVMFFAFFAFFGLILFHELNVAKSAHMVILLFILLMPVISFIFLPLLGVLSRHNEYEADKYGVSMQDKDSLISALMKLADENSSFPRSHFLYITFYHTHPPLIKRLEALGCKFDD